MLHINASTYSAVDPRCSDMPLVPTSSVLAILTITWITWYLATSWSAREWQRRRLWRSCVGTVGGRYVILSVVARDSRNMVRRQNREKWIASSCRDSNQRLLAWAAIATQVLSGRCQCSITELSIYNHRTTTSPHNPLYGWWLSGGRRGGTVEQWWLKPGALGSIPSNCWLFIFLYSFSSHYIKHASSSQDQWCTQVWGHNPLYTINLMSAMPWK